MGGLAVDAGIEPGSTGVVDVGSGVGGGGGKGEVDGTLKGCEFV